jgi:hypothetical protein
MALDPTIPLGVKPIDFLGSAGNLLNLARGAQALQQEQAMNPIQQEKAAIELGIIRDTQDAERARLKAISGQQVTAEQVGRFNQAGNTQERLQQAFAPLFKLDSFQDVTKDPRAAFKDVMAAKQQAIAAGVPPESAEMFSASLYSRIEDALTKKDQTPVNEWAFRNLFSRQTASAQQQAFAPTGIPQATFGGVPGSFEATARGNQFVPSLLNPRQAAPANPMPQEGVQVGGVPLSTGIQERPLSLELSETGPANKQGAGVPLMQPQPAAPAPEQPKGVTAGAMTMPAMSYPFRPQGQPFAPLPGENDDFAVGQKYRNNLIAAQPVMTKARRDLEEVISMADKIEKAALFDSAGVMGAAERKVKSALGNVDYQKLSKDLANARIATIQAKGGSLDTVGGQELVRISNGDETYSPTVIKSVAQRAYGDVIATELEGRAAAAFAQRYGDANHNTFKQLWSKNADSRIFEIITLPKLIQDKSERIKAANEILKNATPKEREEFNRKYQNILRLEQTGSL